MKENTELNLCFTIAHEQDPSMYTEDIAERESVTWLRGEPSRSRSTIAVEGALGWE